MAKLKMTASVVSQAQLAEGIYDLRLKAPEIASQAAAGQFVSVYSKDGSRLLPRPISLCGIDKEAGQLRLVYRVGGQAQKSFSALKAGGYGRYPGASGKWLFSSGREKSLPDRRRYRYSSYAAAGNVCAEWF